MSAETPSPAGGRLVDLLALGAIWLLAIALVDPRGDFPLNDDWAYAATVEGLLRDGTFRPHDWAGMTLLSQALWGALAAVVFGFSAVVLRASTLVLGLASVAGVYLLGRELRAPRAVALLVALALAANPLFLGLSHTFMTDVPMLAPMIWALLCFARALRCDSTAAWAVGSGLSVAGVLCRQPALVVPLGLCAAVMVWPAAGWRWRARAALSVLLALGALWLYRIALEASGGLPANFGARDAFLTRLLQSPLPTALRLLYGNVLTALLYCGLFLLPPLLLFEAGWRRARLTRPRWITAVQIAAAALAAARLLSVGRPMPLIGNVLISSGIGPVTLHDWYIRGLANDPRLPPAVWLAVSAAAVLGVALLAGQLIGAVRAAWSERRAGAPGRIMLLGTGAAYLALTCVVVPFDRYYLPLLPILALALLPPAHAVPRRAWIAAGALLAISGAFAIAATHDYLAWNRARWAALRQLTEDDGIDPRRIDGGLEFNAPRFFIPGTSGGGGRSWWWVIDDEYMISMGPVPGYEEVRRHPYPRWLPPGDAAIAVLKRSGR